MRSFGPCRVLRGRRQVVVPTALVVESLADLTEYQEVVQEELGNPGTGHCP